jgi:uncharacterized membrane protein
LGSGKSATLNSLSPLVTTTTTLAITLLLLRGAPSLSMLLPFMTSVRTSSTMRNAMTSSPLISTLCPPVLALSTPRTPSSVLPWLLPTLLVFLPTCCFFQLTKDSAYAGADITPNNLKANLVFAAALAALSDVPMNTKDILAWNGGGGRSNNTQTVEKGSYTVKKAADH